MEPVCCSMSSSNCCFLTCIQVSQEAGKVVWYSHLFKNFPQFVVIHTVKCFRVVNEAEADFFFFLEFCFFYVPMDIGNLERYPQETSIISFLEQFKLYSLAKVVESVSRSHIKNKGDEHFLLLSSPVNNRMKMQEYVLFDHPILIV